MSNTLKAKAYALMIAFMLGIAQVASASPIEEGLAAAKSGDFATALRLLRPIANQGDASAQLNLGGMYYRGQGVKQNYTEAAKWYRLAAYQGNATAQLNLGGMYYMGQGVPQDYLEAHKWAALAVAGGDKKAAENLRIVERRMTREQIARAQEMANACKASNYKRCGQLEHTQTPTARSSSPATKETPEYEELAANVKAALPNALSDRAPLRSAFKSERDEIEWLAEMSRRLEKRIPDHATQIAFLKTVHYEASRSALDPQLVLGLIDVVSGFKKYAVSKADARGLMQVTPLWVEQIGAKGDDLFDLRKNIRYGCVILRHYLDVEKGDLYRALGHYKNQMRGLIDIENQPDVGSSAFPRAVDRAWKTRWRYDGHPTTPTTSAGKASLASTSTVAVPLEKQGGTFVVPVFINGAITLNFVVDSGAADVTVPADVVLTLMRTGTLKQTDFLGQKTYMLADGSRVPSETFRIRSMKVGNRVVENVTGSITTIEGSLLLGQSFLGRFKSWSIDNSRHVLLLE